VSTVPFPYTVYGHISSHQTVTGIPIPVSVQWSQKVLTVRDGVYRAVYRMFTGAAKRRALIALNHQSQSFVTLEKLDEAVDRTFADVANMHVFG
jgi:hypothetical protein